MLQISLGSLAALFRDLGALLLSDGVEGLSVHQVDHSPLLRVTLLHGARLWHLGGVAHNFRDIDAQLVRLVLALSPGHHVFLHLLLRVADVL